VEHLAVGYSPAWLGFAGKEHSGGVATIAAYFDANVDHDNLVCSEFAVGGAVVNVSRVVSESDDGGKGKALGARLF